MIHDYVNPNTCYAVGDAIADLVGTATTNRQPVSGVEERLFRLYGGGTTDGVTLFDGTDEVSSLAAGSEGNLDADSNTHDMMITNSDYFRKQGTTDHVAIQGVQTNA